VTTQMIQIPAFAALILNDREVGPRTPCILTFSTAGIILDREVKFGPMPEDGFVIIRFFNSPEGGKKVLDYWDFGSVAEDGGSKVREGEGVRLA